MENRNGINLNKNGFSDTNNMVNSNINIKEGKKANIFTIIFVYLLIFALFGSLIWCVYSFVGDFIENKDIADTQEVLNSDVVNQEDSIDTTPFINNFDYLTENEILYNTNSYIELNLSPNDIVAYPNWNPDNARFDIGYGDALTFEQLVNENQFREFALDSYQQHMSEFNSSEGLEDNSLGFVILRDLVVKSIDVENKCIVFEPLITDTSFVPPDFKVFDIYGMLFEHTDIDLYDIESIKEGYLVEAGGLIKYNTTADDCTIYLLEVVGLADLSELEG